MKIQISLISVIRHSYLFTIYLTAYMINRYPILLILVPMVGKYCYDYLCIPWYVHQSLYSGNFSIISEYMKSKIGVNNQTVDAISGLCDACFKVAETFTIDLINIEEQKPSFMKRMRNLF